MDDPSMIGFLLYYVFSFLATFAFGVVVGVIGGLLHARRDVNEQDSTNVKS